MLSLNLKNPIPNVIRDKAELSKFFQDLDIVPYYGSGPHTSHGFLKLIKILCNVSPSLNGSIKDIQKFAFPQKLKIVQSEVSYLQNEEEGSKISKEQGILFAQKLKEIGVKLSQFSDLSQQLYTSMEESGNAYLHIKRIEKNGIVKYFFTALSYENCAYQAKTENIVHTNSWDLWYIAQNTPLILPVSYTENWNFAKTANGVEETILHIFTNKSKSNYYGSAIGEKYLYQLYTEFRHSDYFFKVAGVEVIAKSILFFEKEAPGLFDNSEFSDEIPVSKESVASTHQLDYFDNAAGTISKLYSAKAEDEDARIIGVAEYAHGTKPPSKLDFQVNRDTSYLSFSKNVVREEITAAVGWDMRLTGAESTKSGIGSNILIDLFLMKNASTIVPLQNKFEMIFNDILNVICQRDLVEFQDYGFQFSTPILELVENIAKTKQTSKNGEVNNNKE